MLSFILTGLPFYKTSVEILQELKAIREEARNWLIRDKMRMYDKSCRGRRH